MDPFDWDSATLQLIETARSAHLETFGERPVWLASAPGRVNLIGEHVDYNEGFVLPMAINRRVAIAASPIDLPKAVFHSAHSNEQVEIDLTKDIAPGRAWSNYLRGVLSGFREAGATLSGFQAAIVSNVPVGGGLSSSAALEVAAATLLESVANFPLDPMDKARLCQKAEQSFAGVPCGLMDQAVSVMARRDCLLLLDCRDEEARLVPASESFPKVLIFNTRIRHDLQSGAYALRRKQCHAAAARLSVNSLRDASPEQLEREGNSLSEVEFRRARHVVTEIQRVRDAVKAIEGEDWIRLGTLMRESHASLRDDFEVSCPELDCVAEVARNIGVEDGVFGCRMTGGGFGGCAVALVDSTRIEEVKARLVEAYRKKTFIEPMVFVTRAEEGARLHDAEALGY